MLDKHFDFGCFRLSAQNSTTGSFTTDVLALSHLELISYCNTELLAVSKLWNDLVKEMQSAVSDYF